MNLTNVNVDPRHTDQSFSFDGLIDSDEEKTYGADFPDKLLVARSEWKDRIREREKKNHELKRCSPYVVDQSPTSTCVYCSATSVAMCLRNLSLGVKWQIILSPMSGYCFATRRASSGSTMWGAMQRLTEHGVLPANIKGQEKYFKHTLQECKPFIQREDMPSGFESTAKHFRVLEWFRIDSKEQFASALLNDMPICYGRSGHSIMAEDLVISSRGDVVARYKDSYSTSRGDDGRLYDSERMWGTGGAWAGASVTLPDDPRLPAGSDGTGIKLAA